MACKKLFITGATGYIGGSVLEAAIQKFPTLQVTALLRSPSTEFKTRYPNIHLAIGDFDASTTIEKESQDADIVLHMGDIDHAGCAAAILSGLSKKTTPSFLIHLTGTGCIADVREQKWDGVANPKIWNDIEDIDEIYNLPKEAYHHKIDKAIMDASSELLKTACICPPDIYGQSTGVGNRTTYLIPNYVKALLETKEAFYLGKGENYRAVSHISDVVDLFIIILSQAIQDGGSAQWGKEGFYFAVTSEVQWLHVAKAVNDLGIKEGWLPPDSKPVSWTGDQVGALMPERPWLLQYLWGSNSRAVSERAKKLGWEPKGPSFWEALEEDTRIVVARARV